MEEESAANNDPAVAPPTGAVTLREALAAALARNPGFAAASWQIRINEAEALQAGLPPNPELEAEIADFGGTGETSGFDILETTVSVIQPIELGGDREKRLALAERQRDLAGWDYEAKRLEVISETRRRFIRALEAERRWQLIQRAQELESDEPNEGEDAGGDDAEAGEAPAAALEEVDERLSQLSARVDRRRAKQVRRQARRALAAMWGSRSVTFDELAGDLDEVHPTPPLETLAEHLDAHPRIARWKAAIERHRAAGELAEAEAFPNVEARVGGVHTRETEDYALEIETTVPLPLFDRKQGDRLAARLEGVRAVHQRRAARLELRQQLRQAYAELDLAAEEARSLGERVLPAARDAVEAAEQAVEQDQASQGAVREAKRKLLAVRQRRLEALAAYHRAVIRVEQLIARSLQTVRPSGKGDEQQGADRQDNGKDRTEP